MVPPASGVSPPSTRSRLVFPAPLRPTNPTLSPARTVNDASTKVRRPPTSTLRSRTWSTRPLWRSAVVRGERVLRGVGRRGRRGGRGRGRSPEEVVVDRRVVLVDHGVAPSWLALPVQRNPGV